ncbi:VOC family protein, partial [Micromonospora sp. D75]
MATRLVQINMKAHDEVALGDFWAKVLGWEISSEEPGVTNLEPAGLTYPDPRALYVDLVVSTEPKTAKNRVHVDLATTSPAHHTELVARLTALGATPADVGQGDVPWTVLADPEGNEFCVREPDPRRADTGPIAEVVV